VSSSVDKKKPPNGDIVGEGRGVDGERGERERE